MLSHFFLWWTIKGSLKEQLTKTLESEYILRVDAIVGF